jgi:ribosomal protein S18 acetylase RimI-like enzyme
MKVLFRSYKPADKQKLLAIFKLNVPLYFHPKEAQDFKKYLAANGATYLTIELDNEIVGGTGYQIENNNTIGQVTWIFLHPECKGLGIGRQSVEHCVKLFKSRPTVQKAVVTTSQHAFKFFEKSGFHLIKIEKNYWAQGLDLYVMELKFR